MEDITENKLVITSGPDTGKEYRLLQGSTTLGSAPDNDVQLNDQGISGFHAEIRSDNNSFLILDFNSEKGTYVNDEKILEERQLVAGDRIQLGSVHAVFIPRNGIFAKANKPKVNFQEVLKNLEPYYRKWKNEKNRKILACVLPVIVVLMIALAMSGNHPADEEESATSHYKVVDSAHASHRGNGAAKETTDSAQRTPSAIENDSPRDRPNAAVAESADAIENQSGPAPQDRFTAIYFNIANKFADHQLWQIALEYYHRVLAKAPDHPELSAHIAEMKSEINNQIAYEQGQILIEKEHYQEGIANLRRIPETSYYFQKAAQVIGKAEENKTQAIKNNEAIRSEEQSPDPAESR